MESMEQMHAGMLLVATPRLLDPNFAGTVVLLLDVADEGALGVVLNRPTPVAVAEVLEPWGSAVAEPEVLFLGGPVDDEAAIAIGRLGQTPADGEEPVGFRTVVRDTGLGMVDLDAPPEVVRGMLTGLRIFAGYSGWGAGQLQGEVARGDWYVVPGRPDDVFRDDTSGLLRDVLRRQPGELAWRATRPLDPELN